MQEVRGWEDALELRNGNPLQYSCLENPINREAWWATVRGAAKSQTQQSNTHTHTCSVELDMFLLRNTKLNLHYIQDFQTWETPPEFCKIRIVKVGPGSKLLKLPM